MGAFGAWISRAQITASKSTLACQAPVGLSVRQTPARRITTKESPHTDCCCENSLARSRSQDVRMWGGCGGKGLVRWGEKLETQELAPLAQTRTTENDRPRHDVSSYFLNTAPAAGPFTIIAGLFPGLRVLESVGRRYFGLVEALGGGSFSACPSYLSPELPTWTKTERD
jgi:hypothetical protein